MIDGIYIIYTKRYFVVGNLQHSFDRLNVRSFGTNTALESGRNEISIRVQVVHFRKSSVLFKIGADVATFTFNVNPSITRRTSEPLVGIIVLSVFFSINVITVITELSFSILNTTGVT
jgi:hypothetical protein